MGFHLYRIEIARCAKGGGSFREPLANFVGEPQDTVARCPGKCERCGVCIRERDVGGARRRGTRPYECKINSVAT